MTASPRQNKGRKGDLYLARTTLSMDIFASFSISFMPPRCRRLAWRMLVLLRLLRVLLLEPLLQVPWASV